MLKLAGNILLLGALYTFMFVHNTPAQSVESNQTLIQRIGLDGILCLAAGLLIITGGIDLSMGSLVAMTSTVLCLLLTRPLSFWMDKFLWWTGMFLPESVERATVPPLLAFAITILVGMAVGLFHGIMVTKVRIQAFVVTLCGLFLYRSAARWLADDEVRGLGTQNAQLAAMLNDNWFGVPVHFIVLMVLAIAAAVFLHSTRIGRYFFAIGSNEKAAEYCGIRTDQCKILAYVLCSTLTTIYAILLLMYNNSVQPSSTGNFKELTGIAGAVIGGCSLRGGEGNIFGILLGAAIIVVLPMLANYEGFPNTMVEGLFGAALLAGAILDEALRRFSAMRKS